MHVLVAEDSAVNRELIQEMLEVLGCEITVVENGKSAVTAASARDFDLILLDNHMPCMSGTEAAEAIRKHEHQEGRPRARIAVVTGDVLERDLPDLQSHGIDDYLPKPFDLDALEDLIDRQVHGVEHVTPAPVAPAATSNEDQTSAEVLDPAALDRIRRMQRPDGPSLVERIGNLFLETAPQQLASLESSFQERDITRLQLDAHTLKTGCANIGAMEMYRLGDQIERHARGGEVDACGALIRELTEEFKRVKPALAELIDQETVTG